MLSKCGHCVRPATRKTVLSISYLERREDEAELCLRREKLQAKDDTIMVCIPSECNVGLQALSEVWRTRMHEAVRPDSGTRGLAEGTLSACGRPVRRHGPKGGASGPSPMGPAGAPGEAANGPSSGAEL